MSIRRRVAMVVIAKDEAGCIERLLRSVVPWVDEMLVLDTGSSDATPALAAACGAKVFHRPWPGDFAAARNAALSHSTADWHVVLDADDWLVSGGEALLALRHQEPDFVGALLFHDHFDDGQPRTAQNWISRVFPGDLRYSGRIHEQVCHALPVHQLAVEIGHDGFLPDRLRVKRGRNRQLLEATLAEQPDDAYLWYQLGKDCAVYDEHGPAEDAFERAVGLGGDKQPWWNDLVVRRLYGLKKLKAHALGMDFANAQMACCAELPDFFFAIGDLLLDLAADQPEQAPVLVPMIDEAWQRCLDIGERPDLSGTVVGRGSHLAAHNLALVLEMTGREVEATALRTRYPQPGAGRGA